MLCARLKNRFSMDLSNHESLPIGGGLNPEDHLLKKKRTHSTSFQILEPQAISLGKAPEGVSEATENPYFDHQKSI